VLYPPQDVDYMYMVGDKSAVLDIDAPGIYACCSVLQCVAVNCSELQCVALCCSVLHYKSMVGDKSAVLEIDHLSAGYLGDAGV